MMSHFPPQASKVAILVVALLGLALLAGCGPEPAPPVPTRTPAPTFTPTPDIEPTPVDPAAAATIQAAEAAQVDEQPVVVEPNQPAVEQPAAGEQAEAPVQEAPPTETPTPPSPPEVLINSNMNVRGGPGTNYSIVGAANQGQRYPVKGKSPDGTWWQIDFNGQDGWVFGDLVSAANTESVQVAVNIPAAPPPPTPAPPTNTPPPPAPAEPAAPPAPPKPNYEFSRALLQRCDPNAGVTYVEGTVYKGGSPVNGYYVAFSYAPDGAPVATIQAGPHEGYPGWRTGFYSHIIGINGPREGDWYFWVTDSSGKRVSDIAHVHTDGQAGDGKCQQAVIDFDS